MIFPYRSAFQWQRITLIWSMYFDSNLFQCSRVETARFFLRKLCYTVLYFTFALKYGRYKTTHGSKNDKAFHETNLGYRQSGRFQYVTVTIAL
jgi:hypothetical protein